MQPRQTLTLDEIDLSDFEFWTRPIAEREGAFLTLRDEDPIRFFAEPDMGSSMLPVGPGYYSLTRHADVLEASKHPTLFCSGQGTNIGDMPPDFLEFLGSMINMDDPRHARLRRIVSRGFTPKQLDSMKADVESIAAGIVDDVIERGEGDFVTDVAATLPLRIIVDMMGIPRSQEEFIFDRTNVILGLGDEEYVPDQTEAGIIGALLGAAQDLSLLITELGEARVKDPQDDLTTALVTAEVDGESLSPAELASFFVLLVVAGNETTRNAISHGLVALTEHPEQRAAWQADFDGLAPDRGRGDRALGHAGDPLPPHGDRRTGPASGTRSSTPATRSSSGTCRPTATRRCSTTRSASTSPARPTTTSASAGPALTSASAPTWPAGRSRSCSASCSAACPTCSRSASPSACGPTSSTASSTSPSTWTPGSAA